jgi:RNA polymerase sigma factor (sigma-70 family)
MRIIPDMGALSYRLQAFVTSRFLCKCEIGPHAIPLTGHIWLRMNESVAMAATAPELRFRTLYDRHHPALIAYFARRIGREDSQDAADEVFTVAWRRIDEVPPNDEALLWLYGVAYGVLRNSNRSARRLGRLLNRLARLPAADARGPEPIVIRGLEQRAALDAVASLRPETQELLRLAYWEELTHAEIGEIIGCSKTAVDARIHRALQRMRKALHRSGHIPGKKSGMDSAESEPK